MKTLWAIAGGLVVFLFALHWIGKPLRSGFSIKASPNYPPIVVTNLVPVEKHEH